MFKFLFIVAVIVVSVFYFGNRSTFIRVETVKTNTLNNAVKAKVKSEGKKVLDSTKQTIKKETTKVIKRAKDKVKSEGEKIYWKL